jgi:hypothetical protein
LVAYRGLETPQSYLILVALGAIGSLLRRNVWFDQIHWRIYPNLSCFLVGPSGIGKDTAIDQAMDLVRYYNGNIVENQTVEGFGDLIVKKKEDPSCFFIPGYEAADFFGRKEYQGGKVEKFTNWLTTKKGPTDLSTKSEPDKYAMNLTLTLQLGSTAAWIQNNMPTGTLDGGFFPRFIVLNENYPSKHVPLLKYGFTINEIKEWEVAKDRFYKNVGEVLASWNESPGEITPRQEAIDYYTNWYYNRFSYYGPTVREYANRSRDQLLRVAMLCAILRGRRYIDKDDCVFADMFLRYAGSTIEDAIHPQSTEQQCQEAYIHIIKSLGPKPRFAILAELRKRYDQTTISKAEIQLIQSHIIWKPKDSKNMELRNE